MELMQPMLFRAEEIERQISGVQTRDVTLPFTFKRAQSDVGYSISMTLKYMRNTSVKRWEINSKTHGLFYFRLDARNSI